MRENNEAILLSEPIEYMFETASSLLLINIAKHIGKKASADIDKWELQKLSEVEALELENAKILSSSLADKDKRIKESIDTVANDATQEVDEECKKLNIVQEGIAASVVVELLGKAVGSTDRVKAVMHLSSVEEYRACIVNIANSYRAKVLKNELAKSKLSDTVLGASETIGREILNDAIYKKTRKEAIESAVKRLAQNGITGFIDKSGRNWSADAYVAMDIRTTLGNVAIETQRARASEYGVSTFQISLKTPARERCAPYIGWICSWDGVRGVVRDFYGNAYTVHSIYDTSYGEAAGIFGVNCGHRPLTFVEGISIIRDSQLTDKQLKENQRVYLLTQDQRSMERGIRELKLEFIAVYEATGNADTILSKKIKDKTAQYKEFCKEYNLTPRLSRLTVPGYK